MKERNNDTNHNSAYGSAHDSIHDSHYVGASLQAIQNHYDVSNDFYALWLDHEMVYSGALYQTSNDSLDDAQRYKLQHHLMQSRLKTGGRLLEIGCGWGALLAEAQRSYEPACAVGLTLSEAQCDYARARSLPNTQVLVQNWQDHYPSEPYDAIVSIGAFEHFAHLEYDHAQKTAAYRKFFNTCRDRFLVNQGFMSLQTFAYGSAQSRSTMQNSEATRFLAESIFQETDPPHLSNIIEAIQGTFEIVSLQNHRLHYAKTLKAWMERLKHNRERAVFVVGEAAVKKYELYLKYSYIGFQTGNLDLYRITLRSLEKAWNA